MKISLATPSAWSMFVFGVLALVLGAAGLIQPEWLLALMGFTITPAAARLPGDYTLVFITASSMASFNMGVYYVLAALSNWRAFFRWTVPFRALTFFMFSLAVWRGLAPAGFLGVAVWELTGAVITGLLLWREGKA